MMSVAIGQDGKQKLCVGNLPGRKHPSLYLWTPMDIVVLASFSSDGAAAQAERFIRGMAGARVYEEDAGLNAGDER